MIRASPVIVLTLLVAGPALAGPDCRMEASPMSFGAYAAAQPATGVATLRITCSSLTAQTVTFSIRPGPGSAEGRSLTGGQGRLSYRLFADPAFSQPLDGGAAAITGQIAIPAGQSRSAVVTVYGRAPSRQAARAGDYTDTVPLVLTVN
jgi:spore coat protein U-like protein